MKVGLDRILLACELSGGAVGPPHVIALCTAVRKYVDLVVDMMTIISDDAACTAEQMDELSDRLEDARTCLMPDLPR